MLHPLFTAIIDQHFPRREPSRPRVESIYEEDAPARCSYCNSDIYQPQEHEGPVWCSDECREADGAAAAADARNDLEDAP